MQPFTNSHSHCLTIVKFTTFQMLFHWPKLNYSLPHLRNKILHTVIHHLSQASLVQIWTFKTYANIEICICVLRDYVEKY